MHRPPGWREGKQMNQPSSFAWVAEYGSGNPDQRTARNVLEQVIPNARKWAATDAERAIVDAAERNARAVLAAFVLEAA